MHFVRVSAPLFALCTHYCAFINTKIYTLHIQWNCLRYKRRLVAHIVIYSNTAINICERKEIRHKGGGWRACKNNNKLLDEFVNWMWTTLFWCPLNICAISLSTRATIKHTMPLFQYDVFIFFLYFCYFLFASRNVWCVIMSKMIELESRKFNFASKYFKQASETI